VAGGCALLAVSWFGRTERFGFCGSVGTDTGLPGDDCAVSEAPSIGCAGGVEGEAGTGGFVAGTAG